MGHVTFISSPKSTCVSHIVQAYLSEVHASYLQLVHLASEGVGTILSGFSIFMDYTYR